MATIFVGFSGFSVTDTYPMVTNCWSCTNNSRFTCKWPLPSGTERSWCPTCFIKQITYWVQIDGYRNPDYNRLVQVLKQYIYDNPELGLEI